MKKILKAFGTIILFGAIVSACTKACAPTTLESTPVEEPAVTPQVEYIEVEDDEIEVPLALPTYAQEHDIKVWDTNTQDGYDNTFAFTESDPNGVLEPKQFISEVGVATDVTDNGDGTKTIIYAMVNDISNWESDYYNYSSHTYMVNTATGEVLRNTPGVTVEFDEAYDFNTLHIHYKTWTITCPSDFEDYGLYIADTFSIQESRNIEHLDDVVNEDGLKVIIH